MLDNHLGQVQLGVANFKQLLLHDAGLGRSLVFLFGRIDDDLLTCFYTTFLYCYLFSFSRFLSFSFSFFLELVLTFFCPLLKLPTIKGSESDQCEDWLA